MDAKLLKSIAFVVGVLSWWVVGKFDKRGSFLLTEGIFSIFL